ncbi:hypothetical protein PFDG_04369 [Plasmodium falciparum Dd2]|uniref:Uncharacterized protein n=1 Tax=Plasmodium falciparum (isolate Dd2) TaxID=57267 RepID=A0A0L7M529_PLAF4|nr:hypothetical protein PFDG_04369 [Plasmodium falciparum Dd2]
MALKGVHYDIVTNCCGAFISLKQLPCCADLSQLYIMGFEIAKQMVIEKS